MSLLLTQLLAASITLAQGAALKSDQQEVGNTPVLARGRALSMKSARALLLGISGRVRYCASQCPMFSNDHQ